MRQKFISQRGSNLGALNAACFREILETMGRQEGTDFEKHELGYSETGEPSIIVQRESLLTLNYLTGRKGITDKDLYVGEPGKTKDRLTTRIRIESLDGVLFQQQLKDFAKVLFGLTTAGSLSVTGFGIGIDRNKEWQLGPCPFSDSAALHLLGEVPTNPSTQRKINHQTPATAKLLKAKSRFGVESSEETDMYDNYLTSDDMFKLGETLPRVVTKAQAKKGRLYNMAIQSLDENLAYLSVKHPEILQEFAREIKNLEGIDFRECTKGLEGFVLECTQGTKFDQGGYLGVKNHNEKFAKRFGQGFDHNLAAIKKSLGRHM
ncbi:MAG: hypothetical protein FWE16_05290 [Firmicutes bacterium]|nr:hypothetical protein [Bacillota bacterium]